MANRLLKYFVNNGSPRIHKWGNYFDIYEKHFSRFINKEPTILEIGVSKGGSLRMWRDYFGPGCKIVGVDINSDCKKLEDTDIEIFIGDQSDPTLIKKILDKYPEFDIIIDDGSHQMYHLISSFELLFDSVVSNGVYLLEDLQTCYKKKYGGGLGKKDTFIEYIKTKIDDMNLSKDFDTADSITFYRRVVVVEKAVRTKFSDETLKSDLPKANLCCKKELERRKNESI